MIKFSIWIFFLGFVSAGFSQQNWSLEHCIELGQQNSLSLMVASLKTQQVQSEQQSIASFYLPQINASANQNYMFGSTINPSSNSRVDNNLSSNNFAISTYVELLNMANFVVFRQAKLQSEIAYLSEREVVQNYQLNLVKSFYSIVEQQEYLTLQHKQLVNSKSNFERVKKEVEAGAKPWSDLYDIEYIFNAEQIAIKQSEQLLFRQKLAFVQYLNTNQDPHGFVLLSVETPDLVSNEYWFNPLLERLQANTELHANDRKLIRSSLWPTLGASYEFGSFYSRVLGSPTGDAALSFSDQLGNNKSHYVGLSLRLPVFQGGNNTRRIRSNKAQQLVAQQELLQAKVNFEQQNELIEQHLLQLALLKEQLEIGIVLSQKTFTTTQVKYENGQVDIFSFNSAKNQLLNSQYDLIKNDLNRLLLTKTLQLNNRGQL